MSRIFITGDTHQNMDIAKLTTRKFPTQKDLTKDDYMIICGDAGFVWDGSNEDKYWQKWHSEKSYTTLAVLGNHEGYDLIKKLPIVDLLGGKAYKVCESVYYLINGEIYTINNKTFMVCGGADSHDKQFRTEHISWWADETFTIEEASHALYNAYSYNMKVDYLLSHTPGSEGCKSLGFAPTESDINLDHVMKYLQFDKHYCGHMHVYKVVDKTTILYNEIIEI